MARMWRWQQQSLLALVLLVQLAMAADEDPLQDLCVADLGAVTPHINGFPCKPVSSTTGADFKSSALAKPGNTNNLLGSAATFASVNEFPGLNTYGLTHARADFAVGGYGPLHSHPRATETIFIVRGTLEVAFVSANANEIYSEILNVGDLYVFPRGLLHYQRNIGKGPAFGLVSFNSQNPGAQLYGPALFTSKVPSNVLQRNFGIDSTLVQKLQDRQKEISPPST
eukprot:TRINITY_DN5888_c0_g1_i1.p1 TRINITY_DN5888_c0_g1~~TRINITY_DN5888_c0_g1_i1.p1  ORF type:complete len:251 (+),score=4.22 TRINITY_DN5888_c0_g1_i1:76-753(+)